MMSRIDVDAAAGGDLSHGLNEIGRAVVHGLGAQAFGRAAFLVRSCGRNDARAARGGELNGGRSDAAGAPVHEQPLAGREPAALEDVGPDGEVRLGQRRRLDE